MDNRLSNRMSMQIRQKRNTIMSVKNIEDMISDKDWPDKDDNDDDDYDPMKDDVMNRENDLAELESDKDDNTNHGTLTNDILMERDPQDSKFQATFVTPPEENDQFGHLLDNREVRPRNRTTGGQQQRKLAVKNNYDENDILA